MHRTITDSRELAELRLSWYVRRSNERLVASLPQHLNDARGLRVSEFCAKPTAFPGVYEMKWPKIRCLVGSFRNEPFEVPALVVGDVWVLLDGNHRACAIYLLNVAAFEIRLRVEESAGFLDAHPELD